PGQTEPSCALHPSPRRGEGSGVRGWCHRLLASGARPARRHVSPDSAWQASGGTRTKPPLNPTGRGGQQTPALKEPAMQALDAWLLHFLDDPWNVAGAALLAFLLFLAALSFRRLLFYARFVAKSLSRNLLRSSLTALATMALVFIVTLIWS